MKKLLLSVFAIAAMASCMQDEVISQDQQAIDFGTPFVDKATKAIDYSYSATNLLKEIYVYGTVKGTATNPVSIFEHEKVWTEAQDGDYTKAWQCNKTQYWIPGADYKFVAINGMGDTKTNAIGVVDGLPQTLNFSSIGQTDLVAGYVETTAATDTSVKNPDVSFNMSHLLSKVKFTVINETNKGETATSDFYYKVTEIKLLNAATSGTCTLAYTSGNPVAGTWVLGTTGVSFGDATNGTSNVVAIGDRAEVTSHHELLVVPATYGVDNKLKVSFNIGLFTTDKVGNEVAINNLAEKTPEVQANLVAGHAYNFIIKVSVGQPIQFTVASNPTWAVDADQIVYQDTVVIQ